MNLLFLEQRPKFGGGSERVTLSLCQHAIGRGHRAWLIYEEPGDMVDAYRAAGASCVETSIVPIAVREPRAAWRSLRQLRRLVTSNAIDVVFTSQVNFASLLAAVGQLTGTRTAIHLGLVYDYPSPIFRSSVRRVSLGIAPSAHTAEGWKQRGWPAASLAVIPNGVDTTRFDVGEGRAAARACLGLGRVAGPVVAYVGRLSAAKGIFTLLTAFAGFRRATGTGHLVFVGAAPNDETPALRGLGRQVGLPDEAWEVKPATASPEQAYRAADLVVVPSEWEEPFGLVPLEAMACGTLALVSDRGVMPSFVAPASREAVFAAGDSGQLTQRLTFWLSDAAGREQAAARARTHVRSAYAFEACGDGYLSAFTRLVTA